MPKRFDTSRSQPHFPESSKEQYRQVYFELLDVLSTELPERFCSEGVLVAGKIEILMKDSATSTSPDETLMEEVLQFYDGNSVDLSSFKTELKVFYDFVKQHFGVKRGKSEINVQELASHFIDHDCVSLFSAVTMLFKIHLCMPVTSATVFL